MLLGKMVVVDKLGLYLVLMVLLLPPLLLGLDLNQQDQRLDLELHLHHIYFATGASLTG